MADVNQTLADRAKLYSDIPYGERARISQAIKEVLRSSAGWTLLSSAEKEAMEMIAHKQARIVGGANMNPDNWHDIGGYAGLAEREVGEGQPKEVAPTPVAPLSFRVPAAAQPINYPEPPVLAQPNVAVPSPTAPEEKPRVVVPSAPPPPRKE